MSKPKQDGIEIHFDDKRGHLDLACEPDAFAAYLDLAKDHLEGIPEIDFNLVKEINITNTAVFVAERESLASKLVCGAIIACIFFVLLLAAIGFSFLVSHL